MDVATLHTAAGFLKVSPGARSSAIRTGLIDAEARGALKPTFYVNVHPLMAADVVVRRQQAARGDRCWLAGHAGQKGKTAATPARRTATVVAPRRPPPTDVNACRLIQGLAGAVVTLEETIKQQGAERSALYARLGEAEPDRSGGFYATDSLPFHPQADPR